MESMKKLNVIQKSAILLATIIFAVLWIICADSRFYNLGSTLVYSMILIVGTAVVAWLFKD